jgi:hypothetical protein
VAQKGAVLLLLLMMVMVMMMMDQNGYITEVHEIQPAFFNSVILEAISHYDFFSRHSRFKTYRHTCITKTFEDFKTMTIIMPEN